MNRQRLLRKMSIALLVLIVALVWNTFRAKPIAGPSSPNGYRVQVDIRESFSKPTTAHFADVKILQNGKVLCEWKDPIGQKTLANVNKMVESMNWPNDQTLSFQVNTGQLIRLRVPGPHPNTP
ncbi:hypothetical protein P3T73_08030 [Kiritimatiellota bacterium B12222]|nr:hypothetical protein P3T73_08030 [Kiritimatiellota bacterium B12222]